MSRESDFMMEEEIFLGGKISAKHSDFAIIAMMSPEFSELYMLLKKLPDWRKETDKRKVRLEMIETLGMIEFLRSCSELTRLSMILGDTREEIDVKDVMNELRKAGSDSPT
jgi:dissimilatory sulfite reductase (desulfoviridin) alpha/beta subunit